MSLIDWQVSIRIRPSSQLVRQFGATAWIWKFLVDGSRTPHNRKVGGSNCPPATQESALQGRSS
jgi:hypothetical protein